MDSSLENSDPIVISCLPGACEDSSAELVPHREHIFIVTNRETTCTKPHQSLSNLHAAFCRDNGNLPDYSAIPLTYSFPQLDSAFCSESHGRYERRSHLVHMRDIIAARVDLFARVRAKVSSTRKGLGVIFDEPDLAHYVVDKV